MKTQSITSGPWAWQLMGDTYYLVAQHGRREVIIGAIPHQEMKYPVVAMSVDGRLQDLDSTHPNARVIEASPDLLRACKGANEMLNEHFGITDEDDAGNKGHDEIRMAIKKAEL